MPSRRTGHPVSPATRALASLLAFTVTFAWIVTTGLSADYPPRFDRGKTDEVVRAILAKQGGRIRTGLWVGEPTGDALYASNPGEMLPTASAIKMTILVELFARFPDALNQPAPGLDAILKDDHPAIAHFDPRQRDEVRKGLAAVSVRSLGGIMMGSVPASNLVYNAAANVAIALLGGPVGITHSIRARDPAFAPIAVRRYMLADRKANGDNEAEPASRASSSRSSRCVRSVDLRTIGGVARGEDDPPGFPPDVPSHAAADSRDVRSTPQAGQGVS